MEQEINQQPQDRPSFENRNVLKNLIAVGVLSLGLGAVIVGGMVYFVLNNRYSKKLAQLDDQISTMQNQIDTFESQIETTQPTSIDEQEQTISASSIPTFKNNPAVTECNFWKDREFGKVHPNTDPEGDEAGSLGITGRIIQRLENASWEEGKKVTKVYLVFSDPTGQTQQAFYDRYMKFVEQGNSVNRAEGQQLLFRLGIREGSELITSADISTELKARLISSIDTNDTLQLKLTIPVYVGGGAGDRFSFACEISQ